jgi:tetratricopeptide (TPR) repeat protein
MNREIVGKGPTFRNTRRRALLYPILGGLGLVLVTAWLFLGFQRGQIKTPFQPTPTPTRIAKSYIEEAQVYFSMGKLDDPSNNITITPIIQLPTSVDGTPQPSPTPIPAINDAIEAYQAALVLDPKDASAWAELARIQAYSSNMLRNDTERLARLQDSMKSADKAIELAPDDSTIRAIRAFVLDWYSSNPLLTNEQSQNLLSQAYSEAVRAYQLDPNNALALAYYAEILTDQQKWTQAEKYAEQAAKLDDNSMDTHRVYGYTLESVGAYNSAIQQYQKAADINPNLTFLYILIGRLYREGIKNPDRALEYFDRAAAINAQLGVQNPLPYIEIARTYTQQGQFFVAARNAEKALAFDSTNAPTYGQLGLIYIKARNYEGALTLLKCAVAGCTAKENEMGKTDVVGVALTNKTVAYYYVEYGTVLAFLSRLPNEDYCPDARQVLQQVRDKYPDDPILMGIVQDSEGICSRLEGGAPPVIPTSPSQGSGTPGPGSIPPAKSPSTPTPSY